MTSRRATTLVAIALGGALALAVEIGLGRPFGSTPALATPHGALAGGVAVGVLGATLALLVYGAEAHRQELAQLLANTDDLFRSVGLVIDAEDGGGAVDELLGILLERVRRACDAVAATALVLSEDHRLLSLSVAHEGRADPELRQAALDDHDLDRLLSLKVPTMLDAPRPTKLGGVQRRRNALGVAATPLAAHGKVLGVVLIGKATQRPFSPQQLSMLQLGAERVAAAVDRTRLSQAERRSRLGADHARLHVALQSEASLELAAALDDYRTGLRRLTRVLVPTFADVCAIDVRRRDGEIESFVREAPGVVVGTAWNDERTLGVLDSVRPRLWYEGCAEEEEPDRHLARICAATSLRSVVVAPIQVGGLGVGTLTLGTGTCRRGFRPSDLDVAQDLARRIALALERVWLYQAERQARVDAATFADRLQRLTDAELEISRALTDRDLLEVAVANARWVLDGTAARICRRRSELTISSADAPWDLTGPQSETVDELLALVCSTNRLQQGDCELAVPLVDASGTNQGAIAVIRDDGTFTAADRHLILTLSQTVSTCLLKAELLGEVQRSEARLRELHEASPLATVELSPEGVLRRSNGAASLLLGWPADVGAPCSAEEALSPWFRPLLERAAAGLASVGVSVEWHGRQLEVSCVPLWEQTEHVRGILLVAADMTERHRLWAELRDAQRTEAVAELAGGVAHDFNNLLTVILGYTGMLLPHFDDNDRKRRLLESIERAGLRAADLTNQLLTVSRRQVPKPELVDPAALLRSLQDVISRLCGLDIDVDVLADGDADKILIDPGQLEQVILNLAMNARDAMPRGGLLVLATRSVPGDPGWIALKVCDTGDGMDDATCSRCFEPFFTTKPRRHGTGLGLAAVKGVVEQAGGSVTVESRLGKGTTFEIRFPCAQEHDSATPEEQPKPAVTRERGRALILLVDDEEDIRQLVLEVLQRQGYTVLAAESAIEAKALLAASDRRVDLLLTDVVLPGTRGYDLAEELRAENRDLRVLFMSGFVAEGSRRHLGGAPLLAKPFSSDALVSMVREALAVTSPPEAKRAS